MTPFAWLAFTLTPDSCLTRGFTDAMRCFARLPMLRADRACPGTNPRRNVGRTCLARVEVDEVRPVPPRPAVLNVRVAPRPPDWDVAPVPNAVVSLA